MRISTNTLQLQWLNSFSQRQQDLSAIQEQVNTGQRVHTAKDDPAGAAQMSLLEQGLKRLDDYKANADTARRRLSLTEGALTKAGDMLDRVRELAIQAGGGTQSEESRVALANEARELLRGLIDVANSQDGEGRYLFAGNRVHDLPFVLSGNTVSYTGDSSIRSQRIGDSRVVAENESGFEVFSAIRTGNGTFTVNAGPTNTGDAFFSNASVTDASAWPASTFVINFTAPDSYTVFDNGGNAVQTGSYAPGDTIGFAGIDVTLKGEPAAGDNFTVAPSRNQNIFATVQSFIDTMESGLSNTGDRARVQSALNLDLMNLDRALSNLTTARSRVGSRLAVIDQQLNSNEDLGLQYKQTLSQIRDVDFPTAISELQLQLTGLEAAQKAFARIRSFSLFNLL